MTKTPINLRLDPTLLAALKAQAARENRTLSNLVETALKEYLRLASRKKTDGADAGR
jgi:hypothetical protein